MRRATTQAFALVAFAWCAVGVAAAEDHAPLRVTGSSTLVPLLEAWSAGLAAQSPPMRIEISGGGSSRGPHALLVGETDVASMSRKMTGVELLAFRQRRGSEPLAIAVASDAIAVFVHPTNPVAGLTIPQLDAIFSRRSGCSAAPAAREWGAVGLEAEWTTRSISRFGRPPASGTREIFEQIALCGARQSPDVRQRPGARSTVVSVAESRFAIAYGSVVDLDGRVRAVPISAGDGEPFAMPTAEEVRSGRYPLGRRLWLYAVPDAMGALDERFLRLVRFALSDAGQASVEANRFWRLSDARRQRELASLPKP